MSASATQATPPNDPGPQAAETRGHGSALDDLISMGTGIARFLHDQAAAQAAQQATVPMPQAVARPAPQPAPTPAPRATPEALINTAAAFDDIARTVRRCIMLAQNLDTPKQPARTPAPDRTFARKRILRAVEDTIQRKDFDDGYANCDSPEVLTAELRERMDAPDLDADITSRPTDDIIKDILRDLGLAALPGSRPWMRRTPADIEQLNARAAAPSRPARCTDLEPGPGPQDGHPATACQAPDPEPDQHEPGHPSAVPHSQVAATHAASGLPKDPAEAVAFILHHHSPADARWRPPPGT